MQPQSNRTIMCDIVNHILVPSPTGQVQVTVFEQTNPDGTKSGQILFGNGIQGFLTYGVCNIKPAGWVVSVDDPMGYIHRSFENIIRVL